MNLRTKVMALSAAFAVSTGLVVYGFMSRSASATTEQSTETTPQEQTQAPSVEKKEVTVLSADKSFASTFETTGTVNSLTLVNIFAGAPGMISKVHAQNGQSVKAGDVLFEITGPQGNVHPYLSQLELAQKGYEAAKKGYSLTQGANKSALTAAELQLESAKHLAEGAQIDLRSMDVGLNALQTGEYLVRDSYGHTLISNEVTRDDMQDGVNGLIDSIDTLENQKYNLEQQLDDLEGIDSSEAQLTAEQLRATIDSLDTTLEDLYGKVKEAQSGYTKLDEGLALGENQILGQLAQTRSQGESLYLSKLSAAAKMGLNGDTTDTVKMAEEGVNSTKLRNEASLLQAKTGVDSAAANLQMALTQADGLKVKATIDGMLQNFDVHAGDMVSQQAPVANILDPQAYELSSFVDIETSRRIDTSKLAQVKIANRWVPVKILSIGLTANPMTKLVEVKVQLPKISLKAQQSLTVQFPLVYASENADVHSVFIPLDALIVGTEEQYVFVEENSVAKKRTVKTGTISGDRVEILEGLSSTDKVIVQGSRDLTDGDLVTVL